MKELELHDIKRLHDKAYQSGQTCREKASDDLVFATVTQWDDSLDGVSLAYRGQFDMLRKASRQIMSDLNANPVSIDFEPKDDERVDSADFAQGLYLTDEQDNASIWAYENAKQECLICGFGAWESFPDYESNALGLSKQVIRRSAIAEAVNTVFFDPNSRQIDRSDSKYVSVLRAYSEDGYKELAEELTGEEDSPPTSFAQPEQSYVFPWVASGTDKKIYVVEFYYKHKVKDTILTLVDPLGQPMVIYESQVADIEDDLLEVGFQVAESRKVDRVQVYKYIASGHEILSVEPMPCSELPITPIYGEFFYVEGEIWYEGITRLAKDPQRLRNFQMSYLADLVSQSPRPKPIFTPDQIRGFEFMYNEAGADNAYPYYLQNRFSNEGGELPLGPVGYMQSAEIPQALAASFDLTRQAVEDVANPGLPQNIADPDLSGKAVNALQQRMDQQSAIYQQHFKYAKRYDAKVYAQMASVVYDTPRRVMLTLPDGTRKPAEVMQQVIDRDTGEVRVLNDITNLEWDVYAEIGPQYTSQKDKTMEQLGQMAVAMAQIDPAMTKQIMLTQLSMMDGVGIKDIRDSARKQLVLAGLIKPETPEEEQMLMQAQQAASQVQDPAMVMAQAEMMKAQSDMMDSQNKQGELQIRAFEADTKRAKTEADIAKTSVDMDNTAVDTISKQLDNASKLRAPLMETA